jgi:hypothetical protein
MVSIRGTHDRQSRFFGGLPLSSSLLLGALLAVSRGRLPSTAATGPKGYWPHYHIGPDMGRRGKQRRRLLAVQRRLGSSAPTDDQLSFLAANSLLGLRLDVVQRGWQEKNRSTQSETRLQNERTPQRYPLR